MPGHKQATKKDGSGEAPSTAAKDAKDRPITDVIAGALARAASQSTIHPLDTLKVRMQACKPGVNGSAFGVQAAGMTRTQFVLQELAVLYKGVWGAATGAGIIIGSYFAFYSNTKRLLKEQTAMAEGSVAFVSGATAAVGSSFVKVPLAVCIRSVQAGVYPNVFNAAKTITNAAGVQGLFTGFLPTLLEDVPDMAVKFAVYESLRALHMSLRGEQPSVIEDLVMGGTAGAAAAAATTPLDVVKTRMMVSASERPTILQAAQGVLASGKGWKAFFTGIGPRSVSNGLNSAIFFCFFEAIRKAINNMAAEEDARLAADAAAEGSQASTRKGGSRPASISTSVLGGGVCGGGQQLGSMAGAQQGRIPCLSLAVPLPGERGAGGPHGWGS